MEIINTCHQFGYDQWINGFVSTVLSNANICCEKAVILYIGMNEVNILLDGNAHTILINNTVCTKKDSKRVSCRADIEYILVKEQLGNPDSESLYSVAALSTGTIGIEWDNDPSFFKSDFAHLNFYEISKNFADVKIGDTMALHVETVNNNDFGLDLDLHTFTSDEREFIAHMYGVKKRNQVFATDKSIQLLQAIESTCINKIIERCFDGINFDANYTRWLLRCCHANKLCSRTRMIEVENTLNRLYEDSKKGNESALHSIKECLYEFIRSTKPFYAIITPE